MKLRVWTSLVAIAAISASCGAEPGTEKEDDSAQAPGDGTELPGANETPSPEPEDPVQVVSTGSLNLSGLQDLPDLSQAVAANSNPPAANLLGTTPFFLAVEGNPKPFSQLSWVDGDLLFLNGVGESVFDATATFDDNLNDAMDTGYSMCQMTGAVADAVREFSGGTMCYVLPWKTSELSGNRGQWSGTRVV